MYDRKMSDAVYNSLKNQFLCTLPLSMLYSGKGSMSGVHVVVGVFLCVVLSDLYFFCTHCLLHKYMWSYASFTSRFICLVLIK